MEYHAFLQGSQEWLTHRAGTFNASDAPAMLGISPYKTRTELLDEMATGVTKDVDAATQRMFDNGHRFEALARPLAEEILAKALYPVIGSFECGLSRRLGASFDGLSMDESINFEHKTLNNNLRAMFDNGDPLPDLYAAQIEHQHIVSGCDTTLFMASTWDDEGNLIEERHCFYKSDYGMRRRIVDGWAQFDKDLAAHKPVEIIEKPKPQVSIQLPALFVRAKGEITEHNMEAFDIALKEKLAEVRAIVLVTDQDFSNAKEAAKKFRETAKEIALSKEQMLAQTETIGEAARKMDAWAKDLNATALQLEKDVEREDLAKKRAMTGEATISFLAYIESLEKDTSPIKLNEQKPDFAGAIKGKRNYASMHDAIQTMLSHAKTKADISAKDILDKLAWHKENAGEFTTIFPDLQQIVFKPLDDFKLIVKTRIENHKKSEEARLEKERTMTQAAAPVPEMAAIEPAKTVESSMSSVSLTENTLKVAALSRNDLLANISLALLKLSFVDLIAVSNIVTQLQKKEVA